MVQKLKDCLERGEDMTIKLTLRPRAVTTEQSCYDDVRITLEGAIKDSTGEVILKDLTLQEIDKLLNV